MVSYTPRGRNYSSAGLLFLVAEQNKSFFRKIRYRLSLISGEQLQLQSGASSADTFLHSYTNCDYATPTVC
jgi:hypothetical protein